MPKDTDTKKTRRKAATKSEKTPRKAKKDPNAPKRALSAYMFFSQDWRERVKAENPDASFGELGKILGAKWKEMDDDEKKPYVEKAAKDKERAEADKAAYDEKKSAEASEADEDDE
ncbi:high mobility group box domain-containing protein [Schizophyllum commune]